MRLSSKSQYGLKACFILAQNYPERCVSASQLEKEIAVSGKYIEKIMRMLSGAGIVAAERGVTGGYKLRRAPADITIGDIARALEDNMEIADCITSACERCASGNVWRKLYAGINEVLDSMSRSDTIRGLVRGFMVESYLVDGNQPVTGGTYGQSITDACLGWDKTERLVKEIAERA